MPLQTQLIGQRTLPRIHVVESRWTMAYAAGLQDDNLKLLDTTQASIAVHPLFPVCLEWPSVLDSRALPGQDCLTNEELARGVHATHDLHLLKRLVPGQAYQTTATVVDLQSGRQGARVCLQPDTLDEADELVARTWQTNVSRGAADQVTRLGGRFASMVLMPQELTLQITAQGAGWVLFELLNEGQTPVIKEGFMVWSQDSAAII
jgi:hypothetical protein